MFTAIYLIAHAIIRFCLEWFRGDDRGKWGPLTHTNVYSLLCIFFGALAWIVGSAGGNTPVDLGVRWIDVVSNPMITPVVLVSVAVMLIFGLHYKQVGSWISHPSVGCGNP
jgi:prolipoprotein diacylglyceryltransferase